MSSRLASHIATVLLVFTLITCSKGGHRNFDYNIHKGIQKLDNWLSNELTSDDDVTEAIKLMENYVKETDSSTGYSYLKAAMEAILTIVKAKDCDDTVLTALDRVLYSLTNTKSRANIDIVLGRVDSKLRAKCANLIKKQFEDSKARLDTHLVGKFNDLVKPSLDWNRNESDFDYLTHGRHYMEKDQLYQLLFRLIREQRPELSVVKLVGKTIQFDIKNARVAFRELLLEPCNHLMHVFGDLFDKLTTLRDTAESDFELKQTLSSELSDEFKEYDYRYKCCLNFDSTYSVDYYFFKDLLLILENKLSSSNSWKWDEIFWKMHPKDDYERKYYSIN